MDELGFLTDAGAAARLPGRADDAGVRVIVDIGMHLELEIPADSPFHPGERWTPELAQEFFGAHSGRPADFVDSELARYLAIPGRRSATSSASGPGCWAARQRPAGARRRLRPQGLAHGGAVAGLAGPGRPGGRAVPALTVTAPRGPVRPHGLRGRLLPAGRGAARATEARPDQQPQSSGSTGAVSGSAAARCAPSQVSYPKPSRAQYSKPPSISLTW